MQLSTQFGITQPACQATAQANRALSLITLRPSFTRLQASMHVIRPFDTTTKASTIQPYTPDQAGDPSDKQGHTIQRLNPSSPSTQGNQGPEEGGGHPGATPACKCSR